MSRCLRPIDSHYGAVKCGQCMPCRVSKRREWTGKLLLEANEYEISTFLTLTYSDENVPLTHDYLTTLDKDTAVDVIKRFNHRYFIVGEYGDDTKRAHYHAILFGMDPNHAYYEAQKHWEKGFIQADLCNTARLKYVAKYTTKKLTKEDDHRLEPGQQPEFARFSQRPQLGHKTLERTIAYFKTAQGRQIIEKYGDIPKTYRTGGQDYAWSQYSHRKIRTALGIPAKTSEIRLTHPEYVHPPELMPDAEEMRTRWNHHHAQTKRQKIYKSAAQAL